MKQVSCFLTVLAITFFMSSVVSAQVTAVTVTEEGKVGIGTSAPNWDLHVQNARGAGTVFALDNTSTGGRGWSIFSTGMDNDEGAGNYLIRDEQADAVRLMINTEGNVGIGTTVPNNPLEMASGAHVTVGGVWTDASSRAFKENIEPLTIDAALSALEALEPVQYNYKVDPEDNHLGFIAEDVPDLVASKNRKGMSPMDVVAVLTKVVQQQQQQIAELKARLDAQQ